jgi:peptidoglycan/LPS O-acetylase OafA/YrhL
MIRGLGFAVLAFWVYRVVLAVGFGVPQSYIYEAFDTRADSLTIGCLLAVLLREQKLTRFFAWCCAKAWFALITVGLLVISSLIQAYAPHHPRDLFGFAIDSVLAAILIPQMIAFRSSIVGKWLNWSWMRYLGTISYSLYLYQQIAIDPAKKLVRGFPVPVQVAALAAFVVVLASISYFVVERPALRLKERFAAVPRGLAARAASA